MPLHAPTSCIAYRALPALALIFATLQFSVLPSLPSPAGSHASDVTTASAASPSLPVYFEPAPEQTGPSARFLARTPSGVLYFAPQEVVVSLRQPKVAPFFETQGTPSSALMLRTRFV